MLPILGPILISILSASLKNYQYTNIITNTNTDINVGATLCDESLQAQTHLHTKIQLHYLVQHV